jgi:hypothetical protein
MMFRLTFRHSLVSVHSGITLTNLSWANVGGKFNVVKLRLMGEYIGLWVRDVRLDFRHGLISVHFGISRINLSWANVGGKFNDVKLRLMGLWVRDVRLDF